MAVTGDTRVERAAGPQRGQTVTPRPTISETITVDAEHRARVGQLQLHRGEQPRQPLGDEDAGDEPSAEPMAPMTVASATTSRTCFRVAPTARSSASSRERWASVMDMRVGDGEGADQDGHAAEHQQDHLDPLDHLDSESSAKRSLVGGALHPHPTAARAPARGAARRRSRPGRPRPARCPTGRAWPAAGLGRAKSITAEWRCPASPRRRTARCPSMRMSRAGPRPETFTESPTASPASRPCRRPRPPRPPARAKRPRRAGTGSGHRRPPRRRRSPRRSTGRRPRLAVAAGQLDLWSVTSPTAAPTPGTGARAQHARRDGGRGARLLAGHRERRRAETTASVPRYEDADSESAPLRIVSPSNDAGADHGDAEHDGRAVRAVRSLRPRATRHRQDRAPPR